MVVNEKKGMGTNIGDRYVIIKEIGKGGMGSVYQAISYADPSQDVAIKVINKDQTFDYESLLRFQKEASLMSRLHHPNIISSHELGLIKKKADDKFSGYYIVMEMATGTNLKDALGGDERKDLNYFFDVAIQVSSALDYTHSKNIIHRDIKPQNIIVGHLSREQKVMLVKVLDFGVARLAEVTQLSDPNEDGHRDIVGTPMYMAPEQTPYMNAIIDHRVDLYSLGCVLYQILAGKPPFSANSRERLMRHHAQTSPEPLSAMRPDIPHIVEAIVLKLLAKNPADRYQSAFGLKADLEKAREKLQRHPRPKTFLFPLGLKDEFKSVGNEIELIGRESEFEILKNAYSEISKTGGRSRMTVISGEAGVGKTRLLTKYRSYLSDNKIRFISTSFSRHENNLPYNALANGFNEYLLRVLKNQPHETSELKRKIKTVLGPIAEVVAKVVPGLWPFIDEENISIIDEEKDFYLQYHEIDPEISGSENSEHQNFVKAFSDFTRCLAMDNQPVVFVFDDMQWADEKSIDLIDTFFSHNNSQRFMLVVSYRPIQKKEDTPLYKFFDKFRKLKRRFQEIVLPPLDIQSVKGLASVMLKSPESIDESFLKFIYGRTNGNPSHIVELMKLLVSTELIVYDAKETRWQINADELRSSTLKLDSVDMTLSRIQHYESDVREILEIAAVVGLTFQFALLEIDESIKSNRIINVLKLAMDEGLIHRSPDDEELKHLGKSYAFNHRMIREEIMDSIPEDRKAQLHLAVASGIEKKLSNPSPKVIFTLAHHVNSAMAVDINKVHETDIGNK